MAATIAVAIGRDMLRRGMNIEKECTRLGDTQAEGRAATFKTFTTCVVNKDGSGMVQVERKIGGKRQHIGTIMFTAENRLGLAEFFAGTDTQPCRRDGMSAADPDEPQQEFDAATTGGAF